MNADSPKLPFFPVELRPVYVGPETAHGLIKAPRHRAVFDLEADSVLSVVTSNYGLVTNAEAFGLAEKIMKRVFQMTSLDDMVCFNVAMPATRSFCHIDLIRKGQAFQPWEKDSWTAFLRVTNSYNRTRLLRYELGFCRWICKNGIIFGKKSIVFSYVHTRQGLELAEKLTANLDSVRKLELELVESLHQLKRYHVPEKEMLPVLCRAFNTKVSDDVREKKRAAQNLVALRNQVHTLTQSYFSELGQNAYAALNVLTDYASRPEGVFFSQAGSIHRLQQRAGSWMEEFIENIEKRQFSFDRYLAAYRKTAAILESL